jgi:hypothetical protein
MRPERAPDGERNALKLTPSGNCSNSGEAESFSGARELSRRTPYSHQPKYPFFSPFIQRWAKGEVRNNGLTEKRASQ